MVSALISLYLAFGCALGAAALNYSNPARALLARFAQLFGFFWLPLIGLAIIIQVCDTPTEDKPPR